MAIVETTLPMTAGRCRETVLALARRYPFLTVRELTETPSGGSVWALSLGTGERAVLYSGAWHGNEWITATVLLKFLEELAQQYEAGGTLAGVPAEDIFQTAAIHLVPMVNPDGVDLVTGAADAQALAAAGAIARQFPQIPFPDGWKANLQGVDLNLQFPAGWLRAREIKFCQGYDRPAPRDYVGRAPLDQPESIAMAAYTLAVSPALVLAYHTQGQVIYWQFQDYQVPEARELGEKFSALSGYALEDVPYESGFAGYKDWFIQRFRRPGFTIECGQGVNPLPLSQFDAIYEANRGILVTAALGLV